MTNFFPKLGKASSVVAEASGYPNATTRTCSGDFQVGFSYVAFTHVYCLLFQAMSVA